MKRFAPFLLCALGLLVFLGLYQRYFRAEQPGEVRITREKAAEIADRAARTIGIDTKNAWRVVTWEDSRMLSREFRNDHARRRAAMKDPVVGPRLGNYHVVYFQPGVDKFPNYGDVYVSAVTGEVTSMLRKARAEEQGASPTEAQLRPIADQYLREHQLPGVVSPQFESARPTVRRTRTEWQFRYKVPTSFDAGDVAFYVSIYFIGNRFAGWAQIEEYADGRGFTAPSEVAVAAVRFAVTYVLLLWLLILFLKKYHAGEVGVRTAAWLFGTMILIAVGFGYFLAPGVSVNSGLGTGLDGRQTAMGIAVFRFLFFDVPVAVLVFFAWSVGESYARERWGERLASFDAILRRDPLNATVGRSVLRGVLLAPVVAAAAIASPSIPVALGLAYPTTMLPVGVILGLGGTVAGLLSSAFEALVGSVVCVLFVLAFFSRKRLLPLGFVVVALVGSATGLFEPPVGPPMYMLFSAFGWALAAAAIFYAFDLLTAAIALFFGSMMYGFLPYLMLSRGEPFTEAFVTVAVPLVLAIGFSIAALMTRREVAYAYEDLAPHVKRIVERERVKAEIDAANRIQAALLPVDAPKFAGASFASHYRAATEIGGDYFDFLSQPSGEIGIAFGDVSGHGLTSGIVMAMAKSALLVQVDYDASPRAVMNVLNEIVIKTAPRRILMTFFFGLLDPRSQTLRFSSAGHLDPYVFRAATGKLESLSSWGFPLGVRRREPFREHTVEFATGDKLVLYSDGLIEAVDDDGEPFGFERFEKAILDAGKLSAEEIKKSLLASVKKFTHNRPPEDDQTLVVVSFDEVTAGALRAAPVEEYREHVN